MKIAGRKNDGAWFRTNKFLRGATAGEKTKLKALIAGMDEIEAAYEAIRALGIASGDGTDNWFATQAAWVDSLVNGIPRQIWYGVLSFDSYQDNGAGATPRYTKITEPHVRPFSVALRKVVTHYIFAIREMKDLANLKPADQGNPGGIADGDIET